MILRALRWLDVHVFGARQCVHCGCTDRFGCPAGCAWQTVPFTEPVCTECVPF